MRIRHRYRCTDCGDTFVRFGKDYTINSRPDHNVRIASDGMVLAICDGYGLSVLLDG